MNRKPIPVQQEFVGMAPVRPTVKATPRHDLSKIDAWGIVALFLIVMATVGVAAFVPRAAAAKAPTPRWRMPGIERPADLDEIQGIYPLITAKGASVIREQLFYMRRIEVIKGKEVIVEGWHRDGGDGMAGLDLGVPLRWAPRDEAARLTLPDFPDVYLWEMAKARVKPW